jgi:hypothetical protein
MRVTKKLEALGYCGTDCTGTCHIYRAVYLGEPLPQETLSRWREDVKKFWNIENLEAEQLNCKGCRGDNMESFFVFKLCPIRACARERGLKSCGYCPEMKTCERLDMPEYKVNLEKAKAGK